MTASDSSTSATLLRTGFALVLAGLIVSCRGNPPDPEPMASTAPSYLEQQPPGETPEPFAPGIVNTDAIELNGVVSPDGRYLFFSRRSGDSWDEADAGDVYWVEASVIRRLRQ